jgi:flagellar hook assembly protein FlgD
MLGQVVRTLVSAPQAAGVHSTVWNGRKDDGSPAAAGVYLYRLEAGKFTMANKLILQK